MRVLLVEDDASTSRGIQYILEGEGIIVDAVEFGVDGLEVCRLYDYDAMILDLMLPDIEGLEVIRRLRASSTKTPVIVLSGLVGANDKVKSLDMGADDYITKPFEKRELVSRLQAVIRRSKGYAESVINVGRLSVNLTNREVLVDGKPLRLTCKEYAILEVLCLRKGTTLTKEMFLNHLYGGVDEPEAKIIDVFICKLRRKLSDALDGENYIETIWGRGYSIKDVDAARKCDEQKMRLKELSETDIQSSGEQEMSHGVATSNGFTL